MAEASPSTLRLRLAFLLPALADFWLSASTVAGMRGVVDESLLPRGQFAAVALAWGILLLAGLSRPVSRAWVLRPTALVIAGIGCAFLYAVVAGALPLWRAGVGVVVVVFLAWLCLTAAREAARQEPAVRTDGF